MSELMSLAGLLAVPVPAWIAALAIVAMYFVNLHQQAAVHRRLDGHARCIGHMDRWAGLVDERIDEIVHGPNVESPLRDLSNDQVRKLVGRLTRARAA